jgi:murein DD-endopeptidase MepM/ murein hydrolase activator NlpD
MAINPDFGRPLPAGLNVVGGGWRGPGNHAGMDLAVPQGTPVFAIGPGVVTRASATPAGDLGIFAAIAHPSGIVSRYLHFSELLVQPGQTVRRGQLIGRTGNTGNSAAPHLHIDLKVPSKAVVDQIAAEVGTPRSGFETNITGFGIGVPGEPWIPADRYSPTVIAGAQAQGIPLYRPRGASLAVKLVLIAGFAYAAYRLAMSPSWSSPP